MRWPTSARRTSAEAASRVRSPRIPGSAFSYRLEARPVSQNADDATLEIQRVDLGGTGLLTARGDVVLRDGDSAPITTNGNALTLVSAAGEIQQQSANEVSIDMAGTPAGGAARDLVLIADGDIGDLGTSGAKIRTNAVDGIAGQSTVGDFGLVNTGTGSDGLRIEQITPEDPALRDPTSSSSPILGILAGNTNEPGSIDVTNVGSRIVLGAGPEGFEFSQAHLRAGDDIALHAPDGGIEIENPRFLKLQTPVVGPVFLPQNDASIVAGGDVVLDGAVRTSVGSIAAVEVPEDGEPDPDAPDPEFVHGSLRVEARGTTFYRGDVGGDGSDARQELALLDTTNAAAQLDAGEVQGDARVFRVGDARFRGTLDAQIEKGVQEAPAGVQILAHDLSTSESDHTAAVTFEGDIGGRQALGSLDVAAEQILFTSANKVVAQGDIGLDANPTDAPSPIATMADTSGGLSIRSTGGTFSTGTNDKLSVQGPLSIQASHVHVGDLNAARNLSIRSPDIQIAARAPGLVKQRNGTFAMDDGTDLVADSIAFSSVPTIDGSGTVSLGVGGGGVSTPGRLDGFVVRRFTSSVDHVTGQDMQGQDGEVLDLRPTGPAVVGNPSEDIPRERPLTEPGMPPRFSDEKPAPAPDVEADQLLAFLRCGDAGSAAACDAADTERLGAVRDWSDSALATPRAEQLAASYREMRSRDLSAAFDAAGAGFRQSQGFGEFDAAAFAQYLEQSGQHPEARAAIHQLANLLVEVDLLGLAPEDETRVRRELASELAAEADLPGFDADAVLDAVAATPIELPE